jgi:two-component system, NarL family, nitrate/nitrite response regulator NarL
LSILLRAESGIQVAGTAASATEAATRVDGSASDILLVDVTTDRELETLRALESSGGARVLVLGISEQLDEVLDCAEVGIAGYVSRDQSFADLVRTIHAVARGEFRCEARIVAGLLQRVAVLARRSPALAGPPLTCREVQILELIEGGFSNKEIARRLNIQLATVKNHVHNILEKLGVHSRSKAAATFRLQQKPVSVGCRTMA